MHDSERDDSLIKTAHDPLIDFLNKIVVMSVKFLAVLMVFVVLWALADVVMHIYQQIVLASLQVFNIDSLLSLFGAFLAVLIAIEIFLNIIFYLKKDAIHVPLVLSTALTAVARKVIILDYAAIEPLAIFATAAVILAVGITFWLVTKNNGDL
jgi:uncharacterized membrane protein (DUF373 family)